MRTGARFDLFQSHSDAVAGQASPVRTQGDYVVYVDESGDHGLESIDPNYPVFVLAFVVFHKRHYAQSVVAAVEAFKFKHFGHDVVVLHETDIRKEKGAFKFESRAEKHAFIDELTGIIDASNFILISCVIDKRRLRERGSNPYGPRARGILRAVGCYDRTMLNYAESRRIKHIPDQARCMQLPDFAPF